MSEFYDLLDEYMGEEDALSEIRVVVRRLWKYDFVDQPVYLWQGKGKLFTSDGNTWLGTIDANDEDHHMTPALQDGRDGSSASYSMKLAITDLPGEPAMQLYDDLKEDQWRVSGRKVTVYLAIFKEGEALRPTTPIVFFKELIMGAPKFSEVLENDGGRPVRKYYVTVSAKDNNYGRSNVPGRTYADTHQKQRAKELGVTVDKGSEFLALLANRTFQIP